MDANDRRLRYIWVPDRDVAFYFAERWDGQFLKLPFFCDLPSDACYVTTIHDLHRRCFGFLFRSASFGAVPNGDIIPSLAGELNFRLDYRTIDCNKVDELAADKIDALQAENAALRVELSRHEDVARPHAVGKP